MTPIRASLRCAALLATMSLTCLGACDREGVEARDIPKGVERVPDAPASEQAPVGEASAAAPDRPWTVPDGWTEDPEPRPMRLATYIAPDPSGPVEVAITRFGGRVGGELANINRWRGQMGLAPIEASELDAAITRFATPGYDGYETLIESPQGVMLAAGVYEEAADQTWFVRATAPDAATADRLRDDLFGLARSIAGLDE